MTAGARRIPEAVIERDYVLVWFLTGLAGHPLREALAFKVVTPCGGAAALLIIDFQKTWISR